MRPGDNVEGREKLKALIKAKDHMIHSLMRAVEQATMDSDYWERKYRKCAEEFKKLNEAQEQLKEDKKWEAPHG
jgi:hypothetical protein